MSKDPFCVFEHNPNLWVNKTFVSFLPKFSPNKKHVFLLSTIRYMQHDYETSVIKTLLGLVYKGHYTQLYSNYNNPLISRHPCLNHPKDFSWKNPRSELPRVENPSTEAEWFLQTLRVGEIVLRTTVVAAGEPVNRNRPKRPKIDDDDPEKRRRFFGVSVGVRFLLC